MPRPVKLPFSGARLRDRRERAGLTQVDLSQRCTEAGSPVGQPHLSRLEAGEVLPSAPTLKLLADVLNITVDDLLDQATGVVS